jgi:hypothetical protein
MTLVTLLASVALTEAQQADTLFTFQQGTVAFSPAGVIDAVPLESVMSVPHAAFSAEAETEFTQVLGDGNRIERRYSSMIARDSQGRTRREEEIALIGPLAVNGPSPRMVTILDPVAGYSYTLDERQRTAFRNPMALVKMQEAHERGGMSKSTAGVMVGSDTQMTWATGKAQIAISPVPGQKLLAGDVDAAKITTETLGSRSIEGVMAEGTRTTSTIAAGAIGNVMPIEVVTERWYSRDLQMAVLISRKDPRSGDSVYRLRNIVKAEPSPDLFTIPSDYQVRGGQLGTFRVKRLEEDKARKLEEDKIESRQKP